jgi:hypothetical protein
MSETSRGYTRDSQFSNSVQKGSSALAKEVKTLKRELEKYEKIALQREDKTASFKKVEVSFLLCRVNWLRPTE